MYLCRPLFLPGCCVCYSRTRCHEHVACVAHPHEKKTGSAPTHNPSDQCSVVHSRDSPRKHSELVTRSLLSLSSGFNKAWSQDVHILSKSSPMQQRASYCSTCSFADRKEIFETKKHKVENMLFSKKNPAEANGTLTDSSRDKKEAILADIPSTVYQRDRQRSASLSPLSRLDLSNQDVCLCFWESAASRYFVRVSLQVVNSRDSPGELPCPEQS